MISGHINEEKLNNLVFNYLSAFACIVGATTLIATVSVLCGRVEATSFNFGMTLLGYLAWISPMVIASRLHRSSEERLNKLYQGTYWRTAEGKFGKVENVSDFGSRFKLSFDDGTSSSEDPILLSSTGTSRHLVNSSHFGDLPTHVMKQVIGERAKADLLHFIVSLPCLVATLFIFGAISNDLAVAPFKMMACIAGLYLGGRTFRLFVELTHLADVQKRLSKLSAA